MPLITDQIQEVGLQVAYQRDDGTFRYLRKLMALPFLPHREIIAAFEELKEQGTTRVLVEILNYVQVQWIESSVFALKEWSVYGRPIRTNNDIEGKIKKKSFKTIIRISKFLDYNKLPRDKLYCKKKAFIKFYNCSRLASWAKQASRRQATAFLPAGGPPSQRSPTRGCSDAFGFRRETDQAPTEKLLQLTM